MYELVQLTEKTYYINSPAKIGLYKVSDSEVVLFDTGNDKEAAKKILRVLEAEGWHLKAVYNTHSNADHIGGNQWLQKKTDCELYLMPIEAVFSEYPILEPSFLYGGFPNKSLRNKFLMATPSLPKILTEDVLPEGIRMIQLPGHYFQMVGFITDDGVCFLGDCIFGDLIIEKYHLTFIYDVSKYLETLSYIKSIEAKYYVPSHAEVESNIIALADKNISKVLEIEKIILALCEKNLTFDQILKGVFDHYQLALDMNQYVLVGSTIRSFLSDLMDKGQIVPDFSDNQLVWKIQSQI